MRSMMVLLLVVVLSIVLISGNPIDDQERSIEEHSRFKRATCDLFQNERLCAANCLLRGRSGGYCNAKKVCICR
ncbi:unnamed protein product [Diamesa serratosioi]